jgi:hypothetical protein
VVEACPSAPLLSFVTTTRTSVSFRCVRLRGLESQSRKQTFVLTQMPLQASLVAVVWASEPGCQAASESQAAKEFTTTPSRRIIPPAEEDVKPWVWRS